MKRRKFVAIVTGAAAAVVVPRSPFAQQARLRRVGMLVPRARPISPDSGPSGAFLRGMRELGYVEGKNIAYELRFTEGRNEQLSEHASELVRLNVDVIVAGGTLPTRAAQKATASIPLVMVNTGDPVGSGLIASLARPGGNITGITNVNVDANAKRVDLLRTTFPKLKHLGALLNQGNLTYAANLASLQEAARKRGITLSLATARRADELEQAFAVLKNDKAEAVIVQTDSLFSAQAHKIAGLALANRLPVVGPREVVDAGGLMSYAPNLDWGYHRAAYYVDRILKGAKPAEMPVEQPSKLELVINLRTAKALGIVVPGEVTFLADQLLE